MELITKTQAIDALVKVFQDQEGGGLFPAVFREAIEQVPTIKAVPVVRCKDCKWRHDDSSTIYLPCMTWYPENNFFCAYGERRTDEID